MASKRDRRVTYTKKVLHEALLDILKEKPLSGISISELCRVADINRNTFYSHYDTPHDVLRELEDELYEELMKEAPNTHDVRDTILAACKALEKHKKMSELIFSEIDSSRLFAKIISSLTQSPPKDPSSTTSEKPTLLAHYAYVLSEKGVIAILQDWVMSGFMQPAETVADLTSFLAQKVVRSVESYPSKGEQR